MSLNQDFMFECDLCLSHDIIETDQGYVCTDCGLMAEYERFGLNYPDEKVRKDHEILSYTSIGTKCEQQTSIHSTTLKRLQTRHFHSNNNYDDTIKQQIREEVSRILFVLGFSTTFKEEIIRKATNARDCFDAGTRL